jgi:hypothetical protein
MFGEEDDFLFQCPHSPCPKLFKNRYSLRRHLKTHVSIKEFKCKYCEKEYVLYQSLNEHINSVHKHKNLRVCNIGNCGESFSTANKLCLHKKRKHAEYTPKKYDRNLNPIKNRKRLYSEKDASHFIDPRQYQKFEKEILRGPPSDSHSLQFIRDNTCRLLDSGEDHNILDKIKSSTNLPFLYSPCFKSILHSLPGLNKTFTQKQLNFTKKSTQSNSELSTFSSGNKDIDKCIENILEMARIQIKIRKLWKVTFISHLKKQYPKQQNLVV